MLHERSVRKSKGKVKQLEEGDREREMQLHEQFSDTRVVGSKGWKRRKQELQSTGKHSPELWREVERTQTIR